MSTRTNVGEDGDLERRGQPVPYLSYWAQRERERRAAIFRLAAAGISAGAIARELGVPEDEVAAVLARDRRRPPP